MGSHFIVKTSSGGGGGGGSSAEITTANLIIPLLFGMTIDSSGS